MFTVVVCCSQNFIPNFKKLMFLCHKIFLIFLDWPFLFIFCSNSICNNIFLAAYDIPAANKDCSYSDFHWVDFRGCLKNIFQEVAHQKEWLKETKNNADQMHPISTPFSWYLTYAENMNVNKFLLGWPLSPLQAIIKIAHLMGNCIAKLAGGSFTTTLSFQNVPSFLTWHNYKVIEKN